MKHQRLPLWLERAIDTGTVNQLLACVLFVYAGVLLFILGDRIIVGMVFVGLGIVQLYTGVVARVNYIRKRGSQKETTPLRLGKPKK